MNNANSNIDLSSPWRIKFRWYNWNCFQPWSQLRTCFRRCPHYKHCPIAASEDRDIHGTAGIVFNQSYITLHCGFENELMNFGRHTNINRLKTSRKLSIGRASRAEIFERLLVSCIHLIHLVLDRNETLVTSSGIQPLFCINLRMWYWVACPLYPKLFVVK